MPLVLNNVIPKVGRWRVWPLRYLEVWNPPLQSNLGGLVESRMVSRRRWHRTVRGVSQGVKRSTMRSEIRLNWIEQTKIRAVLESRKCLHMYAVLLLSWRNSNWTAHLMSLKDKKKDPTDLHIMLIEPVVRMTLYFFCVLLLCCSPTVGLKVSIQEVRPISILFPFADTQLGLEFGQRDTT